MMKYIELFRNTTEITQNIIIIINILFTIYYLVTLRVINKIAVYGIATVVIGLLYFVVNHFSGINFRLYFIFYQVPAIVTSIILYILFLLIRRIIPEKKLGVFDVRIPLKNGKSITVNIVRGVSVQGASGSGKTISIAGWILYWLGLRNVPGLVYDYKNLEFVEIVKWAYRDSNLPIHIFAPGVPNKSIFINPIDPKILKRKEDLIIMTKCIVDNLIGGGNNKNEGIFFIQASEGAIAGVITRLKEDYPEKCSYSYLSAIFLTKDVDELVDFIEGNPKSAIEARAFLDSASSDKQMAGIKATLSNAFRRLNIPVISYLMSKNSINLALNDINYKSVLCLVNTPKYEAVYSPILSIIGQAVMQSMAERGRVESYLMFDEAPTLKVPKLEKSVATMRSYGIATIYMLQDKVQAVTQLGLNTMKEILANLSTLFFGKTNDPDTAKFFESYFENIKVKHRSISKGAGVFSEGNARVTVSDKEEKKHKSFEMFKRSTGQFFVFDEKGKSYDANIQKPNIEIEKVRDINTITEWEIQSHYERVLEEAKKLI